MKNDVCGIYGIFNVTKEKWYVGQSEHVNNRLIEHKCALKRGSHHCKKMQEDYETGDVFIFSPIITYPDVTKKELNNVENYYIMKLSVNGRNYGYNKILNTKQDGKNCRNIIKSQDRTVNDEIPHNQDFVSEEMPHNRQYISKELYEHLISKLQKDREDIDYLNKEVIKYTQWYCEELKYNTEQIKKVTKKDWEILRLNREISELINEKFELIKERGCLLNENTELKSKIKKLETKPKGLFQRLFGRRENK